MAQSLDQIRKDAEQRMAKSLEALKTELAKIRTGRANAALLDHIRVDYYGAKTPLNQLASISIADARTLTVTPYDKNATSAIEKAIREADLGLNPAAAGQVLRVPLPPDRKSTRLNSSHVKISYAVFCLKKQ